jgi:hypothetical protein
MKMLLTMKSMSPNARLHWLDRFYGGFGTITVLDALDILCTAFKGNTIIFRIAGAVYPITDLYCDQEVFNLPAQYFMLEWFGGPPDNGRWFQASMLALVVDHCLFAMEHGWSERVCNALGMAENYGEKESIPAASA